MAKIEYSDSFTKQGLEILREMSKNGSLEAPYGDPFKFLVVIGDTTKKVVAVLEVPEDLKEKIGDKAYIVKP